MKKLFTITVVAALMIMLCACSNPNLKDNGSVESVISFDLSTQYEISYKVNLDTKRILHTYVFENGSNEYTGYKNVELSQGQYDEIINKIENLGEVDENSASAVYDYWTVNLQMNANNYVFTYGLSANKNYDNLVEDIINLSSIEIVDSRGNDIKLFEE